MKNILLLIFLFWFSATFAQNQIYSDDILTGKYHLIDSAEEQRFKTISNKYADVMRNERLQMRTLDSLQQRIKNEKDELLKARLDIILLLIKNDKAGDVYEKMREFGDKAILDINKRVAAPAWFYKLDKDYAQLQTEKKEIELRARTLSNDYNTSMQVARAKKEVYLKSTPYDSLKTVMQVKITEGDTKSFLNEVCKLYKKPVTTETVTNIDYDAERIITCGEKTEVFEKKTWVWGGVFCFYNVSNPISLADYNALSNESMIKALNYREQQKAGEK